jgi:Astacin (Peptidase family M12A)
MKSSKNKAVADTAIKPCRIKLLPEKKWVAAANTAAKVNPLNRPAIHQMRQAMPKGTISNARLAVLHTKYWGLGGVKLTVGFIDSTSTVLKKRILSHMNAWGKHCNAKFVLSNVSPKVRISFSSPPPDDGYWSYLGTDILEIAANEPTMNLDSFNMNTPESEFVRVVRHETGHTLGFPHEHLRKEIINKMDKEKTIAYFKRTQGWTRNDVIAQVLTPIPESALDATAETDPHSIMCYDLPGMIMKNGIAVPGGTDIDALDKKFSAKVYPKK